MADVFTQAIATSARLMQANLKRQAPFDTGVLHKSIKVRGTMVGDRVEFNVSYAEHGIYTDLGTGRYRTRTRKTWNPRPGKGKGGIKPRFWLTFSKTVYDNMRRRIAAATGKFIIVALKRVALKG